LSTNYDKHYREENLFGDPLPSIIEFFRYLPEKIEIWDLGAGQGRDSLALAECGHRVRAFDVSEVGLEQLKSKVNKRSLDKVQIVKSDIYKVTLEPSCDAVFMDSMFHFYPRDEEKETGLLKRISSSLKSGGIISLAIIETKKTRQVIDGLLSTLWKSWERSLDIIENHSHTNADYRILILKKQ
jgi:cyclopropane fatty-acyl-phospholipid synthase-like methyltransferase